MDNMPEDGLGAVCNRVVTVCKLLQNREMTQAVGAHSDAFTAVLLVKEKLTVVPPGRGKS